MLMSRSTRSARLRAGTSAVAGALLVLAGSLLPTVPSSAATPGAPPVADPAALVHPLDGTGTGPVQPGTIGQFPGADLPFGMIQWSPDTSPNAVQSGGGYAYTDGATTGLSVTHLSGTGCPSYQDVPILPTLGAIGNTPEQATATFSHTHEQATPGEYQVRLGTTDPIDTRLAVTMRSGISSIRFPRSTRSNVLFKVSGSANPVTAADVRVVGRYELEGAVTSGGFCGTGTSYTLHFVAEFSRPFTATGTWNGAGVMPGGLGCTGSACGAYVTFDTTVQQTVLMKIGISFVSTDDARQNLHSEDPGWSFAQVAAAAHARWDQLLRRIVIGGGTSADRHIFYTALYHSLLFPNVVSDVNGDYAGSDGKTHVAHGREEYANFSEWDIYRSEVQLESLVAPRAVGDMVQSLIDDARAGGWLPKWAIVGGDEAQMNGDSADPIIADAYAMGVRNFDVAAALRDMVKGATQNEPAHGLQIERQYLDQYLSQHYVNAGSLDLTSIDYSIGGSATLEYAIDDFSIAQLAAAAHHDALASTMARRSASWEYLFNVSTGYVGARGDDGSFPPGPAFDPAQLEPGGQTGFEEGNAVQYTWSVPQNLAGLASLMGGDAEASAKLRTFVTALNATRDAPYDWSGNEPDEWAPWEFDWFGSPADTQRTVRAIADTQYADAPVDEPGNDDLGALSSWYVWAALGMMPVTPGTADLALASPLFPTVSITLPGGHRLIEHAPRAAATRPFVHGLTVSGITRPAPSTASCGTTGAAVRAARSAWNMPWLPASALRTGGTLTYALSSAPDTTWADAPANAPPSYGAGSLPAVGFTAETGGVSATSGHATTVELGVAAATSRAVSVTWQVEGAAGLTVAPSTGTMTLASTSADDCTPPKPVTVPISVTGGSPGTFALRLGLRTASGTALPPVVVDVTVHP
jgi:predicted alpha-1,2-mannosidase